MSRLYTVAAVIVLLGASGCTIITDTEDPAQLRSRAESLRARAAGRRKSAREYEVLLDRSGGQMELYQTRLEVYRERRAELAQRLEELRTRQSDLSPQEGERLDPNIRNYEDELAATRAKLDEQLIRIRRLRNQMEHQSGLRRSLLYKARELEAEARRLEKYAQSREQEA